MIDLKIFSLVVLGDISFNNNMISKLISTLLDGFDTFTTSWENIPSEDCNRLRLIILSANYPATEVIILLVFYFAHNMNIYDKFPIPLLVINRCYFHPVLHSVLLSLFSSNSISDATTHVDWSLVGRMSTLTLGSSN